MIREYKNIRSDNLQHENIVKMYALYIITYLCYVNICTISISVTSEFHIDFLMNCSFCLLKPSVLKNVHDYYQFRELLCIGKLFLRTSVKFNERKRMLDEIIIVVWLLLIEKFFWKHKVTADRWYGLNRITCSTNQLNHWAQQ